MNCRQYYVLVSGLILMSILVAGIAAAQCGSSATSTFPNHIAVCPSGDLLAVGQVRDVNSNPCVGSIIYMQFNPPAVGQLWNNPAWPFPLLTSTTGNAGTVTFPPRVGGCAMAGSVTYYDPTGVVLGMTQSINSPDMNADGIVNLGDVALFANAFFGTYSPCADYNVDGVLDLVDLGILAQHLGH